eukprot:CAMPEP_0198137672 /NCGR_PEP_ID=MMETSP1443-20131203/1143_1 /TAXON_ID=186043 /ORGANISM="Entomoneis sp., Strain CCMP2396" /LENGTH=1360 /DNA_ID=CAMNT_0043799181 /DNA_START=61 /DNA_END=4143 /DNA_ORIENTATION=-
MEDEEREGLLKSVCDLQAQVDDLGDLEARINHLGDLEARINNIEDNFTRAIIATPPTPPIDETSNSFVNDEKEEIELKFEKSTFSFITVAKPFSVPFFTAICVVMTKTLMFTMILLDIFQTDETILPVMVSGVVFVAQLISYALSVLTSNDLLQSLLLVYNDYNSSMKTVYDGGGYWQWVLTVFVQFWDGTLGLLSTFVLIATSSTAFDVFLNFAAITFVSHLDDVFFILAERNLIGKENREAALMVQENAFSLPPFGVKPIRVQTILVWTLMFVTILIGSILNGLQNHGKFAANTLYIQFGDGVDPALALHSGFYRLDGSRVKRSNGFKYVEERSGDGVIGYCVNQQRWTFSLGSDPCKNIVAESSYIRSFDVLESTKEPWLAKIPDGSVSRFVPMEDFYLSKGCEKDRDCGGGKEQGTCNKKKRCRCSPDFTGVQCQYKAKTACSYVKLNEDYGADFPLTQRLVSSEFMLVKDIEYYNRPIYLNNATGDVIFFAGLRWVLANFYLEGNQTDLNDLFSPTSHATFVTNAYFVSSPVLFRSPDDSESTPIGLPWFAVVAGSDSSLSDATFASLPDPVRLICAICNNETNPCQNGGFCEQNGMCQCTNGASGSVCQVEPIGNGRCDGFFNKPEFKYDGGDCCKSTCSSTLENTCGVVETNLGLFTTGFDACDISAVTNDCKAGELCYLEDDTFEVNVFSRPFVWLSSNGNVLVATGYSDQHLRVLERIGSGWVPRGPTITVDKDAYIESVSIGSTPASFIDKRGDGKLPIIVALSTWTHEILVFYSDVFDSVWKSTKPIVTSEKPFYYFVEKIGFNDLGGTWGSQLTVLSASYDTSSFWIHTMQEDIANADWESVDLSQFGLITFAALSGNGMTVVFCDSSNNFYKASVSNLVDYLADFLAGTLDLAELSSILNFNLTPPFGDDDYIAGMELDWYGARLTVVVSSPAESTTKIHRFDLDGLHIAETLLPSRFGENDTVVQWSGEGSTVALVEGNCSTNEACSSENDFSAVLTVHIYLLNRTEGFDAIRTFAFTGLRDKGYRVWWPDLAFSDDAKTIAFVRGGLENYDKVQLFELGNHCKQDEVQVRVTTVYKDTHYQDVWSIVSEQWFQLAQKMVFAETFFEKSFQPVEINEDFLDSETNDDFRHIIASKEVCIPKADLGCARFSTIHSCVKDCNKFTFGFVALRSETVLFLTENETSFRDIVPPVNPGAGSSVLLVQEGELGRQHCDVLQQPECEIGQAIFAMVLPSYLNKNIKIGKRVHHPSWLLYNGTTVIKSAEYSKIPGGPYVAEQVCVPLDACYTLEFEFAEFGSAANSGNYLGWLDSKLVFNATLVKITERTQVSVFNIKNGTQVSHQFGDSCR